MRCSIVIFLAGLLCANGPVAQAGEKALPGNQVEMHWSELGAYLLGGQVRLELQNGATLFGEALAVTPEMIAIHVEKSSDKRAYPKGRAEIPRGEVTMIQLTRMKNARGRIGLTLTGLVCGLAVAAVAGYAAGESGDDGALTAGAWAAVVGLPVAGYFAGRAIDRKQTLIKILPD